jgi:DHA1 family multidrug resistance protein-like MFS transporter
MNMEVWKRNLYIIWISQFFAIGGISLVLPFLPLFIRELGVVNAEQERIWSGWAYAGPFLLSFLSTPIWGTLGDKYGRKVMTVRAIFGLGLTQILVGFSQTPFQLVLFRLIQGILSGFIPAALSLVSSNTPKERSGYALGILQTSTAAGSIIGPLIGATLAAFFGFRVIFFINATTCILIGFFIIWGFKETYSVSKEEKHYNIFDNFKYLATKKHLLVILFVFFIAQTGIVSNSPIFTLFVESITPNTANLATTAGIIFSIAGVANMISGPIWGKKNDQYGAKRNLSLALFLGSIAIGLHSIATNVFTISFFRIILGISIGGILPALYSLMSNDTPIERRGGILGIASSFSTLGNMVGPLLGGYIASYYGFHVVFLFGALLLAICGGMILKGYISTKS